MCSVSSFEDGHAIDDKHDYGYCLNCGCNKYKEIQKSDIYIIVNAFLIYPNGKSG